MDDGDLPQNPEDELTLPRSSVNKMIKELLPHLRVANNSRELILNCCTEFILLVSSQSNEVCEKRNKKTILPEHVLEALKELGFAEYVPEVEEVYSEYKTQSSSRKKSSSKFDKLGVSEEELLKKQQELFAAARQQHYEYELAQHNAALAAAASADINPSLVMSTNLKTLDNGEEEDDNYD